MSLRVAAVCRSIAGIRRAAPAPLAASATGEAPGPAVRAFPAFVRGTAFVIILAAVTGAYARPPFSRLDSLCSSIAHSLPDSVRTSRFAVVPFEDRTGADAPVRALSEYAVARLVHDEGLRLVERDNLKAALTEISLSQAGLVSEDAALSVGEMLSAPYVVCGAVDKSYAGLQLALRVVHTESAAVVAAGSASLPTSAAGDTRALLNGYRRPHTALFRSLVVPGWGQFHAGKNVRGAVSLSLASMAVGYMVYATVRTVDARAARDEHYEFSNTDAYSDSLAASSTYEQRWEEEYETLKDDYEKRRQRAITGGVVTAAVWSANLVDALVAGVQMKRRFRPYFVSRAGCGAAAGFIVRY